MRAAWLTGLIVATAIAGCAGSSETGNDPRGSGGAAAGSLDAGTSGGGNGSDGSSGSNDGGAAGASGRSGSSGETGTGGVGAAGSAGATGSAGAGGAAPVSEGMTCADGYTCHADDDAGVIWVMKDDGNVNGPTCQRVCEDALSGSCSYHACDDGRPVDHTDIAGFTDIAAGLGFSCREGGCWWPDAPAEGLTLVSIDTDPSDGSKTCFFPTETTLACTTHPGNANCFGERYAAVCPCVPKALDEACEWACPPHGTTRAVWKTGGTSCLERINYWRRRACEEGWVECPPAGLPPMVECTACHECANSEAEYDADKGAHASFTRCGESAQGEGGGQTCADVIDGFVSERAPDESGVMRCEGHCGPIVAPGCRSFFWGKDRDSGFHTLNWGGCNAEQCGGYCADHPTECFTHETSPSMACDDPDVDREPGPPGLVCD